MERVVHVSEDGETAVLQSADDNEEHKVFALFPCSQSLPSVGNQLVVQRQNVDPTKVSATVLLEKLHLKYEQKPWMETMKLVRHCLEKPTGNAWRGTLDMPLMHCLETLQRSLKVMSMSTMGNRLELLSKQKGLEYHISPTGKGCYITSEMFYVEVLVKKNGDVVDVKLAHHGEDPTVCEELLHLLRMKNFEAFGKHLEGLLTMYQIPGDGEVKLKVHVALQSLENDLMGMSLLNRNLQNTDKVADILHGKVGHLVPRSGGSPMVIEYYASPYHLLEERCNPGSPVFGMKALVTVGGTNTLHKLPISPLLADPQPVDDGNPGFLPLTDELCMDLPACFLLEFLQPVPIMPCLIQKIQTITGLPVAGTKVGPLYDLIIQFTLSEDKSDSKSMDKPSFLVTLPGCQKHCYFINNCSWKGNVLMGVLVSKIPFTHPRHVPLIVEVLRHQMAYNTLISSCVSKSSTDKYVSEFLHFEIFPQTETCFCVSFQNPVGCSLACVTVDVLNCRQIQCDLHVDSESAASLCTKEFIIRVIECCMSIPVTMRAIFKKAPKIEVVCEIETSAVNCEQSQSLKTEENPPAACNSTAEDLNASQSSQLNDPTIQDNGRPDEACSDAHIFHVLDLSPENAQPNGHYDPAYGTSDHFSEP